MTFDENTTYKVLKNGRSCYGGRGQWTPNRNRYVRGKVVACEHGIHYCRGAQLLNWLGPELWLFEDRGDKHDDRDDKCATNRGRITERIEAWNEEVARLFAVDCARAVIRYARYDQRELLHACLDVYVGYAGGYLDAAARDAARDAAWAAERDAAWDAARAAARAAAGAAARDAAWDAERDAAGDAAGDAARAAARDVAGAAAWAAAWAAARDAAWDAARAAARDAARAAAWAAARDAAWDAARAAARDAARAAARDVAGAAAWAAAWAAAGAAARDDQYALLCRYLSGDEGPFVEADDD